MGNVVRVEQYDASRTMGKWTILKTLCGLARQSRMRTISRVKRGRNGEIEVQIPEGFWKFSGRSERELLERDPKCWVF